MLFYRKGVSLANGSKIKVSYSTFSKINTTTDENILPLKYAVSAYNFNIENGALRTGTGFDYLNLPTSINANTSRQVKLPNDLSVLKYWHYRAKDNISNVKQHKIVILASDNKLYYSNIYDSNVEFIIIPNQEDFTVDSLATAVNYRRNGTDELIFADSTSKMFSLSNDLTITTFLETPILKELCIHYERLFAIDTNNTNRLYFSDDLDPANWNTSLTEGGFIDMVDERGDIKKIFSFNDYLYVLREFGITRLNAYGDQSQFSLSHIYTSNTRIFENTACLCGDKIIFLARDGLYAFDGVTASKIDINIDNMFNKNNNNAVSSFHNGRYYLSCNMSFCDEDIIGCEESIYVNNALIELNLTTGQLTLTRGIDIKYLQSVEEEDFAELIVAFNNKYSKNIGRIVNNGKFFEENSIKKWISPLTDLGYANKRKVIKEIFFVSKYDCNVIIKTENTIKLIKVYGGAGVRRVPVNVIGNVVAIDFEVMSDEAYISNPQVVMSLIGAL